jgi:hypothetical protein
MVKVILEPSVRTAGSDAGKHDCPECTGRLEAFQDKSINVRLCSIDFCIGFASLAASGRRTQPQSLKWTGVQEWPLASA